MWCFVSDQPINFVFIIALFTFSIILVCDWPAQLGQKYRVIPLTSLGNLYAAIYRNINIG